MTELTGQVLDLVFENDRDQFKIIDVKILGRLPKYDRESIRVTGNFGEVKQGDTFRFQGKLVLHDKFGWQFRASSYQPVLPREEGSLKAYLSGKKFPGIGNKAAEKIINELGLDALKILKEKPAKIATLPLTRKQKDSLLNGLSKMDSYSELILQLARLGLNKRVSERLYHLYHGDVLAKIKANPYEPVGQVAGYAFRTADRIGHDLQIPADDHRRIGGAIKQVLRKSLLEDGNTCMPDQDLLQAAADLLETSNYEQITTAVNHLQAQGQIVVQEHNLFLASAFQTESEIAHDLQRLQAARADQAEYSPRQIEKILDKLETSQAIRYDRTQRQAIINALTHPISIVTGGPGTGKTTIIKGILQCLRTLAKIPNAVLYADDSPFLLAAPTGRAAKRMGEITQLNAQTIHRLLGLGIGETSLEDLNELNGEILIVDEMSMVDMFLFHQLLSAINGTKHLVFVGDQDQLPSVGPGNVFADLIRAEIFPTTKLTKIHRQANNSSIISLAHAVNHGQAEPEIFQKTANYSFIPARPQQVEDAIGKIIRLALKKFKKSDLQVLTAMYHGPGGIINLNRELRAIMNPVKTNAKAVKAHDETFWIGDRVLQLQNNPAKDIYNGQIGKIVALQPENDREIATVNFDGQEVTLGKNDLLDLTHAYAITIHKAQGSEFPVVILALTMQNYIMLRRNLLYTGITRAERNLVLVGDPQAFSLAVKTPGNARQTGLVWQIQRLLPKQAKLKSEQGNDEAAYVLTPAKIRAGEIDPMIGMKGIKLEHLQPKA